jgi:hypothetical protein
MGNNDDLIKVEKRIVETILNKYKSKKDSWPSSPEGINNLVTLVAYIFWGLIGLHLWLVSGCYIIGLLNIKVKYVDLFLVLCVWPVVSLVLFAFIAIFLTKVMPQRIKEAFKKIDIIDIARKIAVGATILFLLHCFFYTLCHKYHIWCPSENYDDTYDAPPF